MHRMRKLSTRSLRAAGGIAVVTVAALALAGCGGRQDQAAPTPAADAGASCEATTGQITIATGNSTGVYYVLGGGVASVLTEKTALRATAAETGASVQNIEQLVAGAYDIAFSLADTAADAVEGTGAFDAPQPVEALGVIHTNVTQVVVRADSGIERVEDMAGHAISTGSPKSGTEVIATRLLESAGLDIDTDISAQRLELGKTVESLKDGSIQGMFWSGGLPTPALTDLFTSQGDAVRFIDVTPLLEEMQEISGVYAEGAIPAATYGTADDVPTIAVPNVLLVQEDFPENSACAVAAAIWGNVDALATVHPAANQFDPVAAQKTAPIPLAPGAERALVELAG